MSHVPSVHAKRYQSTSIVFVLGYCVFLSLSLFWTSVQRFKRLKALEHYQFIVCLYSLSYTVPPQKLLIHAGLARKLEVRLEITSRSISEVWRDILDKTRLP
jgi:hypothetical protein